MGYYSKGSSFSVEFYKGEWIRRNLLANDTIATTPNQIAAIRMWQRANREKFIAGQRAKAERVVELASAVIPQ